MPSPIDPPQDTLMQAALFLSGEDAPYTIADTFTFLLFLASLLLLALNILLSKKRSTKRSAKQKLSLFLAIAPFLFYLSLWKLSAPLAQSLPSFLTVLAGTAAHAILTAFNLLKPLSEPD